MAKKVTLAEKINANKHTKKRKFPKIRKTQKKTQKMQISQNSKNANKRKKTANFPRFEKRKKKTAKKRKLSFPGCPVA